MPSDPACCRAAEGNLPRQRRRLRSWLSVLETSFVLFRAPRWHRSLRKRVVKAAKLHFVDSGLACHLLGIRSADQLRTHPLRGAVFESWVVAEVLKAGATIAGDFFTHLTTFAEELDAQNPQLGRTLRLVYGGEQAQTRRGVEVLPWAGLQSEEWT